MGGAGVGVGWHGHTVNVLDITKWTKEVNDAEPTLLQDSLGFASGEGLVKALLVEHLHAFDAKCQMSFSERVASRMWEH